MITFFVAGEPKAQPRPRAFARKFGATYSARVYNPGTSDAWKAAIAYAAKPHLPAEPLTGPIEMALVFFFRRPKSHYRSNGKLKPTAPAYHTIKPDRDNLDKAVMDALQDVGMFHDDGQVCSGGITKLYETIAPGVTVTIRPVLPNAPHERPPLASTDTKTATGEFAAPLG